MTRPAPLPTTPSVPRRSSRARPPRKTRITLLEKDLKEAREKAEAADTTYDEVAKKLATCESDLGECSTKAKLVLAGSPQFKEPITNIKTGVDEPYMIIAKVTGAPELTWYKDGVPIPEDPRIKMVKKDAETFELTFQKTAVEDNGNWAVIARNTHGEMSQFFTFAA